MNRYRNKKKRLSRKTYIIKNVNKIWHFANKDLINFYYSSII